MAPISLAFDIPTKIQAGLEAEKYIRNGGVIQDTSGRVVMWLRETNLDKVMSSGISSPLLTVGAASSMLTLGVSVIGFGVVIHKLQQIEKRLNNIQTLLKKIDKKVDISFYANFRAALDLANNAFSMTNKENRHSSALSAINRFLEVEHTYSALSALELHPDSQIGSEYLLTLCLAYLSEIRCYLELEEFNTALKRFQIARQQIRSYVEKYVDLLLTSKPFMFLHPDLKGKVDLARLTKVYQWINPNFTESLVFDELRCDLSTESFYSELKLDVDKWIESLPSSSFVDKGSIDKYLIWIKQESRIEIIQNYLPKLLEEIESIIETERRFSAYQLEIRTIQKLGLNFSQWEKLHTFKENKDDKDLMYIVAKEPILVNA